MNRFSGSKFVLILGYNTDFRSLDRFSSVCGANLMAKRPQFFKELPGGLVGFP